MEIGPFNCSICGESSQQLCVYCTKDACANHRCERCGRCSDCCGCEVPRNGTIVVNGNGHGYAAHHELTVSLSLNPDEPML